MIAEGAVVGNYRILRKLGTGGMGAVFLAEHPLIGKKVALKVIHRELSGNREVVQRFWQEARAVNKIGNEHIVEIHDFGQSPDGDHFYIMEYLEGRTLASLLARHGRFDAVRTLHIAEQLTSGLAAAHATGIIHRDLKPDNVMLVHRHGDPDFVKVLDFGLAKMFAGGGPMPLTAAGVVLGTPQYMSPEACESKKDVDHRTDIYAVGVLMFQMVTGQLPFDGQSMGEVMIKQVTQPPPAPRALAPDLAPAIEQIILRCLAKVADARFPTMTALREALLDPDGYLGSSPPIMQARSVTQGVLVPGVPADLRTVVAEVPRPSRDLPLPVPRANEVSVGAAPAYVRASTSAPVQANTMVIATPPGYSSRPPRSLAVPVLVGLLTIVLTASVVVAVRSRGGEGPAAGVFAGVLAPPVMVDARPASPSTPPPPSVPVLGPSVDARPISAAPDAGAEVAPAWVDLRIDSRPAGAEITDASGTAHGVTPTTLRVPRGAPMRVTLRARGHEPVTRLVETNASGEITVTLRRARPIVPDPPPVGSGSATSPPRPNRPDLMEPE